MIGVTAKLNVKEGMESEFEAVFLDLMDAVRANEHSVHNRVAVEVVKQVLAGDLVLGPVDELMNGE